MSTGGGGGTSTGGGGGRGGWALHKVKLANCCFVSKSAEIILHDKRDLLSDIECCGGMTQTVT